MKQLKDYESKIYSQNGEDGITEYLTQLLSPMKYYVEFGCENGRECNTRVLREKYHWTGLLMDSGFEIKNLNLHKEYITKENIVELFRKYNVPKAFGLLSVDIDYNDFYVLKEILKEYIVDIIIIEYNSTHLPEEDKVAAYNVNHFFDKTNYFGASLLSFMKLCNLYNYSLIYTEKKGVNAFFVNNKFADKFVNVNDVKTLYNTPKYGNGPNGGHPKDTKNRKYICFSEALKI